MIYYYSRPKLLSNTHKTLLLTFLTIFAGFLLAPEAIGQAGILVSDKPVATKEDINGIRALIKKEFSAQGKILKNEGGSLEQVKAQISLINNSLNTIDAQESANLNHLRLSNALAVALLILQIIGLWLSAL